MHVMTGGTDVAPSRMLALVYTLTSYTSPVILKRCPEFGFGASVVNDVVMNGVLESCGQTRPSARNASRPTGIGSAKTKQVRETRNLEASPAAAAALWDGARWCSQARLVGEGGSPSR
jgi:hypothetical protein